MSKDWNQPTAWDDLKPGMQVNTYYGRGEIHRVTPTFGWVEVYFGDRIRRMHPDHLHALDDLEILAEALNDEEVA